MNFSRSAKLPVLLTTIYLLLPNLLFFYYWFRNPWGICVILCILLFLYFYVRRLNNDTGEVSLTSKEWLMIGGGALIWTVLSGIGNLVVQGGDFQGHNVKLYELVHSSWPLIYSYNQEEVIYYFAWYLVPAWVMKGLHTDSQIPFMIWSAIGYFLILCWTYLLMGKKAWKVILLFILGDACVFMNSILPELWVYEQLKWPSFFGSLFEQSSWVPNQFLPAILVLALFLYLIQNKGDLRVVIFPFVMSLTWYVFPAIAIAVLFFALTLYYRSIPELKSLFLYSLRYLVIVIPLAVFYSSSNGNGVVEFLPFTHDRMSKIPAWIAQVFPQMLLFLIYIRFLIKDPEEKTIAKILVLIMFVFTMFRIGVFNDLIARSFICFYFVFFYFLLRNLDLRSFKTHKWLIPFVVIEVFFSLTVLYQKLTNHVLYRADKNLKIYQYDDNKSILEYFETHGNSDELVQYSSKKDSFYQKYLAPN